jgi:hypothetical protein
LPPHWLRNRLLAGTGALFALRLLLSLVRSGPLVVADEIGYLTNARVITGGLAGQLHQAPFYRGGYSLVIAPVVGLFSDPKLAYHLVLVLNALLAASLFPLLYLLLSRGLRVAPRTAIWAAFAAALYPALTILSQAALSENALFPLVCIWLLALAGLLSARGRRAELLWSSGFALAAGGMWVVHYRMSGAVAITVVVLLWLGLRRRLAPAAVIAGLLVIAAAIWGTSVLDHFLVDHNYGAVAENEASERLDDLATAGGAGNALLNLIGQSWYLLVSTFGLVAIVIADTWSRFRGRTPSQETEGAGEGPSAIVLALLTLAALLLLTSAAAFPERIRPDMLIYGRYVEIVTPPLVAIGLWLVATRKDPRRAVAPLVAIGVFTVAVAAIRALHVDPGEASRWNVSALPFVTGELGPGILIGAGVLAALGAWGLLRATEVRAWGPPALAAAMFLAIVAYGAWNPVVTSQRGAYPAGWTSPEPVAAEHEITSLSYDLPDYDALGLYATQWFLPDTEMRLLHAGDGPPFTRYVLASHSWPHQHPDTRAKLVWDDVGRDQAIYRLGNPGAP